MTDRELLEQVATDVAEIKDDVKHILDRVEQLEAIEAYEQHLRGLPRRHHAVLN